MTQRDRLILPRFAIARRWQWVAAVACVLFALTCLVGWPFGYLWPSIVALIGFLPAAFLFNLRCYACGWPAFTDYPAEQRLSQDRRFWTRLWGKDYGGIHLPLRSQCTKCGAPFASDIGLSGNNPVVVIPFGRQSPLLERDYLAEFKRALVGRRCSIKRETSCWRAEFGGQFWIALRVPWRVVTDGHVVFGDEDDGQWFGLPAPVDGETRCASLLDGQIVRLVEVDEGTGDLRVTFDNGTRIDAFHYSGGYEGWEASYTKGHERWRIIALGRGEIAVVPGD